MRIAWFTHRYAPCHGGAETFGREMVRRFVAAGHEASVFTTDARDLGYFSDRRRPRLDAPAVETMDGATVHRAAVRHFPAQRHVGRLLSFAPHWPTRCCRESFMPWVPGLTRVRGRFDAVFAVGFPFTLFPYAAWRTARSCGARLVLTPFLHLSTPGDPVHRLYTRAHGLRLLREADLVVSPTAFEARFLAARGVEPTRQMVLPMAVDLAAVTGGDGLTLRRRLGIDPRAPLAGQLGALDPEKGTLDLAHAIARLNARRPPEQRVHLLLAGAPSPAFLDGIARLGPGREAWLHVLGPVDPATARDLHAALDVFAMPSRTDSFGIVYLEAWANARPVIAAAAGGVVDVVRHERNGLLVPFGDREALARAVARLVDDPRLAARLGAAGRDEVLASGTWDDRFERLHRRVVEPPVVGCGPDGEHGSSRRSARVPAGW